MTSVRPPPPLQNGQPASLDAGITVLESRYQSHLQSAPHAMMRLSFRARRRYPFPSNTVIGCAPSRSLSAGPGRSPGRLTCICPHLTSALTWDGPLSSMTRRFVSGKCDPLSWTSRLAGSTQGGLHAHSFHFLALPVRLARASGLSPPHVRPCRRGPTAARYALPSHRPHVARGPLRP